MMQNLDFSIENNVIGSMYKSQNKWYKLPCNLISLDMFRYCNEEYPSMVISNIFAFELKPDYGP